MDTRTDLKSALSRAAALVKKYRGKSLTEQDTKNAIIEPLLDTIGWKKNDLDLVRAEYRHTSKDNPVDYALFSKGRPVLFVEAKALDKSINDHKFINQAISYANVSGVKWALLTNGEDWHLYTVFAQLPASQKRLFAIRISRLEDAHWFEWIVPDRLAGNDLETMWGQRFAARKTRESIRKMISERDSDLVDLLSVRTGLPEGDVTVGLQQLRVRFEEPEPTAVPIKAKPGRKKRTAKKTPQKKPAPGKKANTGNKPGRPAKKWALPKPVPSTKPISFQIHDDTWSVSSWRDILLHTCEYLWINHRAKFKKAVLDDEFAGRKRRHLDRSPTTMRTAAKIKGGYVEIHISAENIIRLVERMLVFCDVDPTRASYNAV